MKHPPGGPAGGAPRVQTHTGPSPDFFCVVYGMHYLYFIPYALVCTALIVTCKLSHVLQLYDEACAR